jgi:hypothetical protein
MKDDPIIHISSEKIMQSTVTENTIYRFFEKYEPTHIQIDNLTCYYRPDELLIRVFMSYSLNEEYLTEMLLRNEMDIFKESDGTFMFVNTDINKRYCSDTIDSNFRINISIEKLFLYMMEHKKIKILSIDWDKNKIECDEEIDGDTRIHLRIYHIPK